MFERFCEPLYVRIIANDTHQDLVQGVQGHNVRGPNVLCLNKSINIAEKDKVNSRPSIPFA